MPTARVIFNGNEVELGDRLVTSGRATDNTIPFPEDANVSRYHLEIERRSDGYWAIDLNSSNGTTVNGERMFGERPLNDGDEIVLGGTSELQFVTSDAAPAAEPEPEINAAAPAINTPTVDSPDVGVPATPAAGGIATEAAAVSKGSKNLVLVLGILAVVVLLCVVGGAAAIYFGRKPKCDAKATITKPETGDTIANPTDVEVEADDTGCVAKAVFTLDGVEIASAESEPYTATLDPGQYPDLADGLDHSLQIVLLDENGDQIGQPVPVMLAFETRKIQADPTPEITQTNTPTTPTGGNKSTSVSLLDIQQMAVALVKQFRNAPNYKISDKSFLQEIQKRTGEYALAGYSARASAYRDAINFAYVREQNVDAPLGFIIAMSRSKFVPNKQGDNEGLWQMSSAFVTANAYNGMCGTETLSDPSQNCAAKASAL